SARQDQSAPAAFDYGLVTCARIVYNRTFNEPEGGELVMSLATTIYYAWLDTTNEPIIILKRVRSRPFPNFQYTVRLSAAPETAVNPLKLGIAYCWILDSVWKEQRWLGCINAEVLENNGRSIGTLEVADIPQPTGAPPKALTDKDLEKVLFANESYSTTTRSGRNANGPPLASWFTCLYTVLLYLVARHTSGNVASELPPYPFSTDIKTYHFQHAPEDPSNNDQINVYIS
ncbi:MAG: hypothetical protein Q9184_005864, partial [Pyrenodesmia sp. 2 TL-2023]